EEVQMVETGEKAKVARSSARILGADIAGYSALMGAVEAGTVSDLKAHQARTRRAYPTWSTLLIETSLSWQHRVSGATSHRRGRGFCHGGRRCGERHRPPARSSRHRRRRGVQRLP